MANEKIHVGVTDVICTATFVVGDEGILHVAVSDGVREFELDAGEVDRLYEAIVAQRRRAGRKTES